MPPLLAAPSDGRMLFADVAGDLSDAPGGVYEAAARDTHQIQQVARDHVADLLASACPTVAPRGCGGCGSPDTFVPGDTHTGSARGDPARPVILDGATR